MDDLNMSHDAAEAERSMLKGLGWRPFFVRQLSLDDDGDLVPVRVTAVHRSGLHVLGPGVDAAIPPFADPSGGREQVATIGDWLLYDPASGSAIRLLDRQSLFKRRAPGSGREVQLIAANIDTVFIVTSCNQDFNIARLERYLTIAREAQAMPVIVITKADLAEDAEAYAEQAQALDSNLCIELVNATEPGAVKRLHPWCAPGQTVVFVGSSGVGKSTLIKSLTGQQDIATQEIREDDAKGRHTTSSRELYQLENGAWLVDTPGMRELQMVDVKDGLALVFSDLADLAAHCRFSDCRHETEPRCAVLAAIERGEVDADRVQRWKKLIAEEERNSESLSERRARDRAFGNMIKAVKRDSKK
ncbi:MAG: ribosome small subunit-dependent GTPase A [Rhodobacteraceae bacterium]|nr:ribosome small subunit-dependent GTPase A [Paracoccaceae bacterium]